MVRVALLTTIWKRHSLEEFVLRYYKALEFPDLELSLYAVGSEGEASRGLCERSGWNYLEHPNKPLSLKTQAGVEFARQSDPDFLVVINSDDLISQNFFHQATSMCDPEGALGLVDIWFLQRDSCKLGHFKGYTSKSGGKKDKRGSKTMGCGRVYSKACLDKCDWKLYLDSRNTSVDQGADEGLRKHGLSVVGYQMEELGVFAVDVKTPVNIWKYKSYEYEVELQGDQARAVLARHGMLGVLETE